MKYLFVLISFFLMPSSCIAETPDDPISPYKIGVILPVSGKSASVGIPMKNAAQMAYETLPTEKRKLIKLFYEDDQMSPSKAVAAFQKLYSVNKINAAIVFGSAMGNAIAPIADKKGVITIALVASDTKVWKGRQYVFSHWMPLESQAQAMVAEIKRRKYKKIAMISQEQEGINAIDKVFLSELENQGLKGNLVLREKILMDETDFRTLITKARTRKVDGVYVITLPGAANFAKQARTNGLGAELFGVQTFENEAQLKASEGTLIGGWYVNADEPSRKFSKEFKKKFNLHPGLGAVNSYDAIRLLFEAVSSGQRTSDNVASYLRNLKNYRGAAGTYSSTGDNRFTLPVAVKEITKKGFRKIRTG